MLKIDMLVMKLTILGAVVAAALVVTAAASHAAQVSVGAKVLASGQFALLKGKRVGVVTNHTALVDGRHVVDLMKERGVTIAALYAPEHGIRGEAEDGVKIRSSVDTATGATVFSLYGETKKPTPEMLQGVDLLLFDMQDVGARFYTYISTMGLAMQAAAEAGIPFVVLDRPNPLGGNYVSGYLLQPEQKSFTGLFPIPVVHGLTVGELALMIKGEKMLPGLDKLDLKLVSMMGWKREMRWPETGLPWVATSPNIPEFEAALLYPGMCFLEATAASEGRGTSTPFRVTGMPDIDAEKAVAKLRTASLPGVTFESCSIQPKSQPGISTHPKYRDRTIPGIRIRVTDHSRVLPVETGVYVLSALMETLPQGKVREEFIRKSGMRHLAGTTRLTESLGKVAPEAILQQWEKEVTEFRTVSSKYLQY